MYGVCQQAARLCVVHSVPSAGCPEGVCAGNSLCVSTVCVDVSYTGVWRRERCILRVGVGRVCVCVRACPGVKCVPVGVCVCVHMGAAEGEGSWAASLSSLDRAPEKI